MSELKNISWFVQGPSKRALFTYDGSKSSAYHIPFGDITQIANKSESDIITAYLQPLQLHQLPRDIGCDQFTAASLPLLLSSMLRKPGSLFEAQQKSLFHQLGTYCWWSKASSLPVEINETFQILGYLLVQLVQDFSHQYHVFGPPCFEPLVSSYEFVRQLLSKVGKD